MSGDSYTAEYYAARESWYDWKAEAKTLIQLARLESPACALEIGCGSGGLLKILGEMGIVATGVDTLMSALALAQARTDLSPDTRLVGIAPNASLPFADNTFDAVLGQHVIEHIPGLDCSLAEWKRVLTPGGWLAIATPNALYPDPAHFRDNEHVSVYTPVQLGSLLQSCGFAVDSVTTMFPYLSRFRPLRAVGVRAYRLFQHMPVFASRGRTLILSARAIK